MDDEEDSVVTVEEGEICISAIDPAPENMAISQRREGKFYEAGRSIHITGDGRIFEWEEGACVQLTIQWAWAHRAYWKDSKFIFIENQFAKRKGKERACLLVRNTLESFFLTLYLLGQGPKPICEAAVWWKKRVGVEIGGDTDHERNKERALEVFRKHPLCGPAELKNLGQKFGAKVDDAVEARLMCIALMNELPLLFEKGDKFFSAHKEHKGKTRFKEEERWLPLSIEEEKDPMSLRLAYSTSKQRLASGKKKRKDQKTLKDLRKYDAPITGKKRKQ